MENIKVNFLLKSEWDYIFVWDRDSFLSYRVYDHIFHTQCLSVHFVYVYLWYIIHIVKGVQKISLFGWDDESSF